MKKDLMNIICCPTCKKDLTLKTVKEEHDEVITGTLHCAHCNVKYDIIGGIPNLLPKKE